MGDQLILQLILTTASIAYQQAQTRKLRRKMEEEAEKRKGMKVTRRGEAYNIPVIYGRAAVGGLETRHRIMNSYTYNSDQGNTQFKIGSNWDANISGNKNAFLLTQAVLGHEGIDEVVYINTNDSPYDKVEKADEDSAYKKVFDQATFISKTGGTALGTATANGIENTAKFTGCAHSTSIFKLNRDDPQYSGFPSITYFVRGQKVKDVTASYTLTSTKNYSNNPALVLLDYLMNETYGLGLAEEDIDLPSFYSAKTICDTTVSTGRLIGGRIHGHKPILNYPALANFPEEGSVAYYYKDDSTDAYYYWQTSGETYTPISTPTRNIPLFECNIVLDTTATIRDNINRILSTMLNADLTWSSAGKYKLQLAYPDDATALNALVNSDHVFGDDDIIRDSVEMGWPSAEDRLNQVTCTFLNEHEDFKQDSVSWPRTGSSVHNTYLTEDNNRVFTQSVSLEGVVDPYHALARAESLVRQSRTMHTLSFTANKKGLTVEPGDFIKLNSTLLNIDNDVYRVLKAKVNSDLTVEIEAVYADPDALAWSVDDDIAYKNPQIFDFRIRGPRNLTATSSNVVSADGSVYSSILASWDEALDTSVRQYEVQYKKQDDTNYNSAFTKETQYQISNVEPDVIYDVRVRAITALGVTSSFVTTTGQNDGKDTDPNPPSNLAVTGGFELLKLTYTLPSDKDFKRIEVREGSTTTFNDAIFSGYSDSNQYIRSNLSNNQTLYFWIRAEDRSGNFSSWVGPQSGTTSLISTGSFDENLQDVLDTARMRSISSLTEDGNYDDEVVWNTSNNKLYRWTGTAWSSDLFAGIEDNAVTNAKIAVNAITEDVIAASAITSTKISNNAISSAKIAANAITAAKIAADAVTADKVAANAITASSIAANAITSAKISAGAVTADTIASNAVISSKIAAGAVSADSLQANSISTELIEANAINVDKMDIDGSLALDGPSSSFTAGRTGTSDFGTDGFYIGRTSTNGTSATGFQLSHTSITNADDPYGTGLLQGIIHDDNVGMRIYSPVFMEKTGTTSTSDIIFKKVSGVIKRSTTGLTGSFTTASTVTLAGGSVYNVAIYGGGGGGSSGYGVGVQYAYVNNGSAGGSTSVTFSGPSGYSGPTSGSAGGGAGGAPSGVSIWGSMTSSPGGTFGEGSAFGAGGAGGAGGFPGSAAYMNGDPASASSHFSAGGGGGGTGLYVSTNENWSASSGGEGGKRGKVTTITIDLTNKGNGTLTVTAIGNGGAGAAYENTAADGGAGGKGGDGIVVISQTLSGYKPLSLNTYVHPALRGKTGYAAATSSDGTEVSSQLYRLLAPTTSTRTAIIDGFYNSPVSWQNKTSSLWRFLAYGTAASDGYITLISGGGGGNYSIGADNSIEFTSGLTYGLTTNVSGAATTNVGAALFTVAEVSGSGRVNSYKLRVVLPAGIGLYHYGDWSTYSVAYNSVTVKEY